MRAIELGSTLVLVAALSAALVQPHAVQNPVPPLVQESLGGRESFEFYCASCHGPDARGNGPIASQLRTPPADLTTMARRNGGAFPRAQAVDALMGTGTPVSAHGPSDMPVWGPIFRSLDPSDARVRRRIENIVDYLEQLQVPTSASGDLGARLYRTHCATCHGTDARGTGPMVGELRRMPPDLTKFTARNGGVFPSERVRRIIDGREVPAHGTREMPVWGDAFRDSPDGLTTKGAEERIAAIVRYLQAIQERAAE